jgi:hypothetical protein
MNPQIERALYLPSSPSSAVVDLHLTLLALACEAPRLITDVDRPPMWIARDERHGLVARARLRR